MYKLLKSVTGETKAVLKDGTSSIPFDPDNTDYQQYLTWLEAGNQPEPAEEQ